MVHCGDDALLLLFSTGRLSHVSMWCCLWTWSNMLCFWWIKPWSSWCEDRLCIYSKPVRNQLSLTLLFPFMMRGSSQQLILSEIIAQCCWLFYDSVLALVIQENPCCLVPHLRDVFFYIYTSMELNRNHKISQMNWWWFSSSARSSDAAAWLLFPLRLKHWETLRKLSFKQQLRFLTSQ